ncbi:hypothetical protein GQ43DRAFT_468454 [Delitschia confertaspora ATCC 74209]|uniref:Uncharacterized protein n=1 Tax=Delitschia confertaspora ATCC 74209 TaxID=1513339 RepID=A0A9P4JXT1_9PLEO|nr:hypothetical protein GQ43DRAFT_468454 [Delitschia confertaspora ATCC 74209]
MNCMISPLFIAAKQSPEVPLPVCVSVDNYIVSYISPVSSTTAEDRVRVRQWRKTALRTNIPQCLCTHTSVHGLGQIVNPFSGSRRRNTSQPTLPKPRKTGFKRLPTELRLQIFYNVIEKALIETFGEPRIFLDGSLRKVSAHPPPKWKALTIFLTQTPKRKRENVLQSLLLIDRTSHIQVSDVLWKRFPITVQNPMFLPTQLWPKGNPSVPRSNMRRLEFDARLQGNKAGKTSSHVKCFSTIVLGIVRASFPALRELTLHLALHPEKTRHWFNFFLKQCQNELEMKSHCLVNLDDKCMQQFANLVGNRNGQWMWGRLYGKDQRIDIGGVSISVRGPVRNWAGWTSLVTHIVFVGSHFGLFIPEGS